MNTKTIPAMVKSIIKSFGKGRGAKADAARALGVCPQRLCVLVKPGNYTESTHKKVTRVYLARLKANKGRVR